MNRPTGGYFRPTIVLLALLVPACLPVGDLQEESRTVQAEGALSAQVTLKMGAGELLLRGGAAELMEGFFSYNVEAWEPEIEYRVAGEKGFLIVTQGKSSGVPIGKRFNRWEIDLSEDIPLDVGIDFGAGEGRLDLAGVDLRSLTVDMGVGDLTADLTGPRKRNLKVDVDGGVGSATLILPEEIGVRVQVDKGIGSVHARDFIRRGPLYTNAAFGRTEFMIDVTVDAGIGSIDLRLR